MRKFRMTIETDIEIELDDKVIDVVDDEWRKQLYDLNSVEDIASHIGYNMVVNNMKLSELDGWADQPNENAKITQQPDWSISYIQELNKVV